MSEQEQGHTIEYPTLLKVWAALVVLTAALVAASRVSSTAAVWAMLVITPLKAALVLYFFMHLKYEKVLLKGMVFTALATLITFIGLLFLDISFR
ncbi:MAG: cytochrome C oxidase subunit IV family protein [Elusimicrobia bacterium]|nr:cytochrome C oxidase subunit IV family protein [Elusimicrobiota bacterium]